jgi:hypothetical protein
MDRSSRDVHVVDVGVHLPHPHRPIPGPPIRDTNDTCVRDTCVRRGISHSVMNGIIRSFSYTAPRILR